MGKVQPWAERNGVGRDTIYALWRGRDPRPDTLRAIAAGLGVTYDELVRVRSGAAEGSASDGADPTAALHDIAAAMRECTDMLRRILSQLAGLPDDDLEAEAEAAIARTHGTRPHRLSDPTPTGR
jgi:transcriptional regulator with XRE-family HTH domain